MSNSSVCGIVDIPDEILVKIILYFNATERLALANSCQRFNDLVFGDKELLRNLDFTREWPHTKESDIQQYFNNENTYNKILKINAERVWAFKKLTSSIGKAINLVEINILDGVEFKSVEELSRFLEPLVHLKRLSVNWPDSEIQGHYDNPDWGEVLKEPFGKFTYLSLKMFNYSNKFLLILQLCQQLEELHMVFHLEVDHEGSLSQTLIELSNLKFVRLSSFGPDTGLLRNDFMSIVPDPAEWTDFYLDYPNKEIHLERNVEVCAELAQVQKMPPPVSIARYREPGLIQKTWSLAAEHLLSEAVRVTHQDSPKKFCCLSSSYYVNGLPCLLDIDEAKKLLKDPGYQISYLCFSHNIEQNCDIHLLASAFPNLTTLALQCHISDKNSTSGPEKTKPLYRRLRKNGSLESGERSKARNTDSSFKMLVQNTPFLKVLTIGPEFPRREIDWDLDALCLISHWTNLTVIHLRKIPITDGQFLIDIGRECTELEELVLDRLGSEDGCSYESELLQMLQLCKNLRRLSIGQNDLEHMSEMFDILSNSSTLRRFCLDTSMDECDAPELASSIAKFLCQCQKLQQLSIGVMPFWIDYELQHDVERILNESNRPEFQFPRCDTFNCVNSSNIHSLSPWVSLPHHHR